MLNRNQRNLMSFIVFNVGWWVCFLSTGYQLPWAGPIYALFAIAAHLWAFPNPKGELLFATLMTLIGATIDSSLMHFGLFQLLPTAVSIAPPWLIAMWTLFALTMESSEPLRRKWWLLVGVSALTGPFSYFCGETMGSLLYARPLWISLLIHAAIWAALMPGLYFIRDWCLRKK